MSGAMSGVMSGAMGSGPGGAMVGGMMQQAIKQHGDKMVKEGTSRLLSCLNITALKVYFQVDNSYVLKKLLLIMLPFRHASWARIHDGPGDIPQDPAFYKPPSLDINAPDLYIPTMAFITYILLFAYALGIDNRFTPEVLSLTASWAMITLFFEIMLLWAGFYFLNVQSARRPHPLDLLAYTSYKFIGVIFGIISGLSFGTTVYYCVTCSLGISMGIFLMRSLSYVASGVDGGRNNRMYFLFFIGILQVVFAIFLSRQALPDY